jgi:hypothetical protein
MDGTVRTLAHLLHDLEAVEIVVRESQEDLEPVGFQ